MTSQSSQSSGSRPNLLRAVLYDPDIRGIVFQVLVLLALVIFFVWLSFNTASNLRAANIPFGFDFLWARAGFDISQKPIDYTLDSTHSMVFWVGLLNTLIVAALGIFFATIIGFLVGIARLSKNWLLAKAATIYVETLRNIPLLLQLLFWYKAVLSVLPGPKQGYMLPFASNLSNRGLTMPRPVVGDGFQWVFWAFLLAVLLVIYVSRWAKARQMATGQPFRPSGPGWRSWSCCRASSMWRSASR
jgi:general L-amino acid transport system permease protein